ncbi:MAG TPA: alpha/beta hydrolase, partial [Caulobacteraceae bacterium]|nr:alpha/beta hydrolase [Caulobacteraceae bacterium]
MAKVALIAAAALVVVLIGGICAGLAWRVWRQHEVARLMAITSPPGIDEGRYVRIGGIEQWITIRGQDRRNPVILMIDGGPGAATSVAAPSALEKDFVLVEWDQPGAGKTYGRSGPLGRDDTIERLALDGIALADQVRHDLKRDKVILVGVSWGSIVGVRMALARPDLFTAYIGTGQFANMREGDALAYASTMAKAKARRDTAAIRT